MPSLDRAVGIDLGTTNSEVAWLPPSERELVIYADRFGRRTVPSAVAWDEKVGAFVVGHAARTKRGSPYPPVESIKRKMGQNASVRIGPQALSPEEISSKILLELRQRITEALASTQIKVGSTVLENRVTRAVITVPAYFDAPQVEATRRAGELAGFQVIGILQEPTAAAIYHTWKRRLGDGDFLVYDLGGGTFDVSILRSTAGEYQVLAIDGDNYLGGDDFDRRFAEHLRKELCERGYSLDLDVNRSEEDRALFARLIHLAQEIKESLSTAEVVHVSKNDFMKDKASESVSYVGDVGRGDYERVISELVETTLACCERALARAKEIAGTTLEQIEHVILVGGSTRVPLVARSVTERFCRSGAEPLRDDVDTCVALGAAVYAANLGGTLLGNEDIRVRLTTPLVSQGAKLRLGLTVERAPQNAVRIAFWEGDRALAEGPVTAESMRFDLPLGETEETSVVLALQSSIGVALAELPLSLHRGDLRPRPTALSRASVVAKDISLEVVRGGKRERKILLSRGMGLPAQVTQVFFTSDQSGAVVLRILQGRLPIKTLVVEVPRELPVGSPVEVVLRCDESMRLEAEATVSAQKIEAYIEPPQTLLTASEDVESLLEQAEKARRGLWGSLGAEYAREADALVVGIREVLFTDPDKLEALCQRLRHLVEEFHGGANEDLVPPMQRMEETFDALRRLVYRSSEILMGMKRDEWEARIDALHDRAMAAHDAGDGPLWRRVFNEVQALFETAYQEEFSHLKLDDPAYIQRRILTLTWRAQRVEQALAEMVPSTTDEIRALQRAEHARLTQWMQASVSKPLASLSAGVAKQEPAASRRTMEQIDAEIERIEVATSRLPSMGLVTDRGGR